MFSNTSSIPHRVESKKSLRKYNKNKAAFNIIFEPIHR